MAAKRIQRALVMGSTATHMLRAAGLEVQALAAPPGVVHLPALLKKNNIDPDSFDLFVQMESLRDRVFLSGVDTLPCPTVFWGIDSHLNYYWQRHYARLFDVFCTPHAQLIASQSPHWRLPAQRLAIPAPEYTGTDANAFIPHSQRPYGLGFVGIIDRHRPLRAAMLELLGKHFTVETRQGISRADMLDMFGQTRCIPNESITFEVNFRLLEGAARGACVLSPDIGEDQNTLLAPGTEMRVYEDGCDLVEQLAVLLKRPALSEAIGRAAHQRVQTAHLPVHRGRELLGYLGQTPENTIARSSGRLTGPEAEAAFVLTLCQLDRNGMLPGGKLFYAGMLDTLPDTEDVVAARVRHAAEKGHPGIPDALEKLLANLLGSEKFTQSFQVNMAAAAACLFKKRLDEAKRFWYRLHTARPDIFHGKAPEVPESAAQAAVLWAQAAMRQGMDAQPGFRFEPLQHCPESAFEFLFLAESLDPADRRWLQTAERLTAGHKSLTSYRLGIMARRALDAPADWRVQTEYGLSCLSAFRLEAGLGELAQAREQAQRAGREREFFRLLDARSQSAARLLRATAKNEKGAP